MRRFMLTATAALALGAFAAQTPALAGTARSGAQDLVNDSTQVMQHAKQQPHFAALLRQAKGVFIMPAHVKAALGIGGAGSRGVLLAREANGRWSDPAFMTLGSVSLGLQAGAKAGPTVMLLMTDKALHDFMAANNFSLNANAGLTVADYSAQGQAAAGKHDVIIWSKNKGAFAGADASVTDITADTAQDKAYYGKTVSTPDILRGHVTNKQADMLRSQLPA